MLFVTLLMNLETKEKQSPAISNCFICTVCFYFLHQPFTEEVK